MEEDTTSMASSPALPPYGESEQFSGQDSSDKRTALLLPPEPPSTTTDRPTYQRVASLKEGSNVDGTDTAEPTSVLGSPTESSTQGGQEEMVPGLDNLTVSRSSTDESCSGADASQQQHAQATPQGIEPPESTRLVGKEGVVKSKEEEKENDFLEQELDVKSTKEEIRTILARWNDKGFGSDCDKSDENDILKFLRLATILNLCGVFIDYCVCCGRRKKLVKIEVPNSHIWPKGVLKKMQKKHYGNQKDFILNLTDGKWMGAGGLTARLLCFNCENEDSKDEQSFCKLYSDLLSTECCHDLQVNNEGNWLKRVFVKIMFLGLVINIFLPDGDRYDQVFINLWRYYRSRDSPIDIRLFLLPSKPFVPISELSSLERALRNICFTSLVRKGEEEFLYTQCDIFHVVLPISKESRELFDSHYNCFSDSAEGAIVLRPTCSIRHGFQKAHVRTDYSDCSYRPPRGITYEAENPYPTFPMTLIEENARRIPELELKAVVKPQKDFQYKYYVPVTLFPGRCTIYPHEILPGDYPECDD